MSYHDRQHGHGGGGYNRRGRGGNRHDNDGNDRRRSGHGGDFVPETLEQRLKALIAKFSDEQPIDPRFTVPTERVAKQLFDNAASVSIISDGFRIAVTELPFKAPYYAALLARLHGPKPTSDAAKEDTDAPAEDKPPAPTLGRQVLEEFWKGFQAFLDKLSWLELRLCIHFFAHLAVLNVISTSSLLVLLQSFAAVLDEPGVSYARGSNAAFCVGDGIIRAWSVLHEEHLPAIETMITSISNFVDTTSTEKYLVQPMVVLHVKDAAPVNSNEVLDNLVSALRDLVANGLPEHWVIRELLEEKVADIVPYELPSFLVPPDVIEMEGLGEGATAGVAVVEKKDDLPSYLIRLFDNEIAPDPVTPAGYTVRTMIMNVVTIFEVNRKEAARLLLELPKWLTLATFKAKTEELASFPGPCWQLETLVIETILSMAFFLPSSQHKTIYYISLITELCKLVPTTFGPAVGKSIRKLYAALGDGLDVEVARRFTEWFATHMSNFNFAWVWKEWVGDISLSPAHPKRDFIRRAIEIEIRLAYYDRIAKSLPEPFQAPEAGALPAEAPGFTCEYDDPTHPHHDTAQTILRLLRDRTKAEQVISETETIRTQLQEAGDARADSVVRSITLQSLLHVGSRSFSHLLNAIERYLPLLRALVAPGADARADVLRAVGAFWARSGQLVAIVVDKLMQYQIVEPVDVVGFAFAAENGAARWELLRAAIDKANGRLRIAHRRVAALRKDDEDARAKTLVANGTAAMEVDSADVAEQPATAESEAVAAARKACEVLARDQRAALSRALESFIQKLSDPSAPRAVLEASSWEARGQWGEAEWKTWQTWCWYRHFCRAFASYLRAYSQSLSIVAFASLPPADADAVSALLRRTWAIAVEGGEP